MALTKTYDFVPRNAPQQSRARKTIETILHATAELLEEVGFEQLSTNQICKRADVTPPALYHYFHNKYDVVRALGERLFEEIKAAIVEWVSGMDPTIGPQELKSILIEVAAIVNAFPSGARLIRSLHASPKLSEMRQDALNDLTTILADKMISWNITSPKQEVVLRMRMAVEIAFATLDLVLDDDTVDQTDALQYAAETLNSHLEFELIKAEAEG